MVFNSKKNIISLFSLLEDSRHPSVGPHLRLLSLTGIWYPNSKTNITLLKRACFYVIVLFFVSQYLKCIIKFKIDSLQLILEYAPFHMGIVKTCFFQKDYNVWQELVFFISKTERDQIAKKDPKSIKTMQSYISRNRKITYSFWALAFIANIGVFSKPYQNNQSDVNGTITYNHLFDGYTPFSEEPPGYYFSMGIETILGHVVSFYVLGWDTLVVSIMIFFAGQMQMSRLQCSRMINGSPERTHKNIIKCHKFHTDLIKYQKQFNSLISPVMFVYLFVSSINLSVCIVQIAEIEDDFATVLSSFIFLLACLIQLLLFYWHSNEVTVQSELVSYSTFESNWTSTQNKLQKEVALLGLTTSKTLVFTAGSFNHMTLATFISIIRASYSFYALLNSTKY
ncbi:odorant receptor 59b-like [Bombyx mandarina]|uniref:Odorant receptor n=1 Tax=Bombyx mandarina TaxID=7092 RepID=A0A6J2JA58_BOMMA|nr:odorant receptor 59b-like [Bombyx mandarina]